jgi:putative flippase GtrA
MFLGLGVYIIVVLLNALSYTFFEVISNNISRSTHRLLSFLLGVVIAILIHFWLEKKWLKEKNIEAEEAIKEIGKD